MPMNKQLTEEPQIGIEPMTAPLQVAPESRFPSVSESEHRAYQTPRNAPFRQNAHTTGEQVASRGSRVKATEGTALLDRIRDNVAFSAAGCWEWKKTRNGQGYGQLGIRIGNKTVSKSVHRLVAGIVYGEIPKGMLVCHHCDVRHCCNPEHLYIGTVLDNARDAKERGRSVNILTARNASKTHCAQGHPFSNENVQRNKAGHRMCRTCRLQEGRRQSAKRAAARAAA